MDALKRVNSKEVILVHVGGHPVKEYKAGLDRRIKELGLEKQVVFIGNKPVKEIIDFYKMADVFVNTGFRESYCIPILEALAAGLPTLTTKVGVAGDVISDGGTGYLIENERQLAEGIERLRKDKRLREGISKAGRKKAREFDWEAIISKLESVYREVLG